MNWTKYRYVAIIQYAAEAEVPVQSRSTFGRPASLRHPGVADVKLPDSAIGLLPTPTSEKGGRSRAAA